MLQESLPCMNIGPQPSTEGFDVYAYSSTRSTLNGLLAIDSPHYPFKHLKKYSASFTNRFNIHEVDNKALKGLIYIDTPGILSGKKNFEREYNFFEVIEHLASVFLTIIYYSALSFLILQVNLCIIHSDLEVRNSCF